MHVYMHVCVCMVVSELKTSVCIRVYVHVYMCGWCLTSDVCDYACVYVKVHALMCVHMCRCKVNAWMFACMYGGSYLQNSIYACIGVFVCAYV